MRRIIFDAAWARWIDRLIAACGARDESRAALALHRLAQMADEAAHDAPEYRTRWHFHRRCTGAVFGAGVGGFHA